MSDFEENWIFMGGREKKQHDARLFETIRARARERALARYLN